MSATADEARAWAMRLWHHAQRCEALPAEETARLADVLAHQARWIEMLEGRPISQHTRLPAFAVVQGGRA